ncbi:hypothetical protein ACSLBF_15135 [Pseudoalteromonas sp. T1lg65]|uniref:hypothetical protein n=1 Tax=Pseudoalteromonas sp. T1lg65 TaxID=2077101 RepID=UPI003F796262
MSKGYWYLLLALFMIFVFDALGRLTTNVDNNEQPFDVSDAQTLVLPSLAPASEESITAALSQLSLKATQAPEPETNGMSPEQQALQSGELESVYAKDKILTLKAVVQSDQVTYALIQVTPVNGGMSKLQRFNQDSRIEGFTIKINSNTKVELVQGEQKITLIMYQTTKN